jgi:hypothetical protein
MGEVYSAGDVKVNVSGMNDVNPSNIEYGHSYPHEYQRGIKREPRGWRMGGKEMNAKMTVALDVLSEFEKIAPFGDIAKIRPFPIVVTFANFENDMITDVLNVKFTGTGRNVTNDGELERELELFPLDIKYNV